VLGRKAFVQSTHITFLMCATIMGKLFRFEYNLYGCVYRWQLAARWSSQYWLVSPSCECLRRNTTANSF